VGSQGGDRLTAIEAILADPAKTALAIAESERMLARAMEMQERGEIARFYPVVYLDNMQIIERIELVFKNERGELVLRLVGRFRERVETS
jgi:hypothetical protein